MFKFGNSKLFFGVSALTVLLVSCSETDGLRVTDKGVDTVGLHAPHTGPADGIWPPQPQNMANVEPYPASARSGALSGVLDNAKRSILNNPQIRASLGDDYREIESSLGDSKGNVVANTVFYNYATDETIDAALHSDGSITNRVTPALVYQPTEHSQEVDDAIALARAELNNAGFDLTNLQGTAMLAFPPASTGVIVQQHFYPQRMLYVTFGSGAGQLPVYTALVDLSAGAVTDSGLVK